MARLVFGMNVSLDGYVDHVNGERMPPGRSRARILSASHEREEDPRGCENACRLCRVWAPRGRYLRI